MSQDRLNRVYKLMPARWRYQSITYRVREHRPIKDRLQSINWISPLSPTLSSTHSICVRNDLISETEFQYLVRKISSPLRMVPLWTRTRLIPTMACCIFFLWVNFNASPFGWRNVFKVFKGSIWTSLVNVLRLIPVTVLNMFIMESVTGIFRWFWYFRSRPSVSRRIYKDTHQRGVWQVIANFAPPILKNPVQLSLIVH